MPISKDEFRSIDEDGPSPPDLAPDTTQGAVYRFLLEHADHAFRQREIVDAEHAVVSAGVHGAATADEIDTKFDTPFIVFLVEAEAERVRSFLVGVECVDEVLPPM
jgi:hypothetical protein